ncbi:MAG: alpha/beta fold hydrolase [Akkermansiaceae bacterium]|nr:alpha/beta fold hydrolase [Akkermansiaceae bacterium]MCP5542620.1 alpha/beta fold hydrolase [Akkermansiaceae bacterium]MCP5548267.1 alpha/beta fold hydrolase [Akkermansiaceae bacterium]
MRFLRRHWGKFLSALVGVAVALPIALSFWAAGEIASPPRRTLQDYHNEYLAAPEDHGMAILSATAPDGTPYLTCLPGPFGRLGKRGNRIRDELSALGYKLPPTGTTHGTLVLCHGRKGRKEDYFSIAERFCAIGFRCVIPDFPAHGDHPGKIATYGVREGAIPAMVLRASAQANRFSPEPAGLMGMSMGGSIAMHATAEPHAPWQALVVVSSFDEFRSALDAETTAHAGVFFGSFCADATERIYQQRSGVSFDDIRPVSHAANLRIPALIIHGDNDGSVPTAAGRRLFDAIPPTTPKKWLSVPGANHQNVLVTDFPVYAEIAGWMLRHVTAP